MKNNKFIFWAMSAMGTGISGGDRIFAELAKRWSKQNNIDLYVWEEGLQMCNRMNIRGAGIKYKVIPMKPWSKMGFVINYLARIFKSIFTAMFIKIDRNEEQKTILYSASDFWMDVFPCFILKLRFRKVNWVATWYQTAPNPIKGFSEIKRKDKYRFSAFLYWLSQAPVKPLISHFSNYVLVNNESEKKIFPNLNKQNKAIVFLGAVDTNLIDKFKMKNKENKKIYDAVFQGRFHPQKGVVELIDIWKDVVSKDKSAKLILIGDGPLMEKVKRQIATNKLEDNVIIKGYVFDGDEKYKIFNSSKIVVHPALYDSGGMAAAEAMAFSLPCVGFDLKAYDSYYPTGMIKSKNNTEFTKNIVALLNDETLRNKIGKQAKEVIYSKYTWDYRAEQIYNSISK